MKIEAGKKYINNKGQEVLIRKNDYSEVYPFRSGGREDCNHVSYTEDGYQYSSKVDSNYNLVEEVIETKIETKVLELGKTYKDYSGGSVLIIAVSDGNYPFSGTYVSKYGEAFYNSYTKEGFFYLENPSSKLNLIIEEEEVEVEEVEVEEVKETEFKVGKYYRSLDGTLFLITGIESPDEGYIYPIHAKEVSSGTERTFTLKGEHYEDTNNTRLNLVCVEIAIEESLLEDKDNLPDAEIKEEEVEDLSFNSVEEIFIWLVNGNKVQNIISTERYSLVSFPYAAKDTILELWIKYTEPKVVSWFDKITEKGVFCWVFDEETSENQVKYLNLVTTYDPKLFYPFRVGDFGYKYAVPLTKEELLERSSEGF